MNENIINDLENDLIQIELKLNELKKENKLIFEFKNLILDNDIKINIYSSLFGTYSKYLDLKIECLEFEENKLKYFYELLKV